MRSVMALSPQRLPAALKAVSTRFRRRTAWAQRGRVIAPAVRWRHETVAGSTTRRCCLGLDLGEPDPHAGQEKQASSVPTFGGSTRPKKPVRRCFKLRPPWRAGFAGFASGCRSLFGTRFLGRGSVSGISIPQVRTHVPGGCPASCPDAHRPARGHRHVRIWAGGEIGESTVACKQKFQPANLVF